MKGTTVLHYFESPEAAAAENIEADDVTQMSVVASYREGYLACIE